jgi:Lrp/AsnC family transcriptional regulator, regulator for asnA, asnC and gidA
LREGTDVWMKGKANVLDDVERGIVRLLQEDGRMFSRELSRRLSVSEPTIRKKLTRMLDEGIVKIRAVADPASLGYNVTFYMGFVVERAKMEQVARKLCEYDFVDSVTISTGPNDITIKACFESLSDISDFLFNELGNVDGIKDTDTTLILHEFKFNRLKGVVGFSIKDDANDDI